MITEEVEGTSVTIPVPPSGVKIRITEVKIIFTITDKDTRDKVIRTRTLIPTQIPIKEEEEGVDIIKEDVMMINIMMISKQHKLKHHDQKENLSKERKINRISPILTQDGPRAATLKITGTTGIEGIAVEIAILTAKIIKIRIPIKGIIIITTTEATTITTTATIITTIRIILIEEECSRIKGKGLTDEITWEGVGTDREAIKITKTTTTATTTTTIATTITMIDKTTEIALIVVVIGLREGCQLSHDMVRVDSIRKGLYNAYNTLLLLSVIMMIEIAIIETILGVNKAITGSRTIAITII